MPDLTPKATAATASLLAQNDDDLYAELAIRLRTMRREPESAGQMSPIPSLTAEAMSVEDLQKFGRRFFERVNRQAFELMCGSGDADVKEREGILKAFGVGKEAVAPALAALLIAQLGLAPMIAPVVAVLAVRLFFKPGYDAMCEVWGESFDKPADAPAEG